MNHHSLTAFAVLVLLGQATLPQALAQAQPLPAVQPDAGQVLQQQQQNAPSLPLDRPPILQDLSASNPVLPGGRKVTLHTLKFSGNTRLTDEQLRAALPPQALAEPLDLAGIQALANQLTRAYRDAGHAFARVYVPAQVGQSGEITFQVVEGRYGYVQVQGAEPLRSRAQAFLSKLRPNEVIETSALERATLLLGDLPGVRSSATMQPGQAFGTGDLVVEVQATPRWSGKVSLDNQGNRYTGAYRARVDAQMDSPLMVGDQLLINALISDNGLWLGSLAYSAPIGADGWRVNASVSHTAYELGEEFALAQAHGKADVFSAGVNYPWLRSQRANVRLAAQWQHKRLDDRQDAASLRTRKSSDSVLLSVGFDAQDTLLGGGITYGNMGATLGRLNLAAADRAQDAATARTHGDFPKVNLDVARLQSLPVGLQGHARLSVQWAPGKNLDSSEGFGAGGPSGVRAYPVGEAYGDEGWLSQWELRYPMGSLVPYVFYDAASIKLKTRPWSAGNNLRNIAGAGLGIRGLWRSVTWESALAWRTRGGAPLADTRDRHPQLWVSVQVAF